MWSNPPLFCKVFGAFRLAGKGFPGFPDGRGLAYNQSSLFVYLMLILNLLIQNNGKNQGSYDGSIGLNHVFGGIHTQFAPGNFFIGYRP